MDATTAASLASITTAVLAGVAGLLVIVLRNRQQSARRSDRNAQDLINRQEKRIERLEQQLDEYQSGMEVVVGRESRCRIRLAEIHGHLRLQRTLNERMACIIKERLDLDLGPLPPLPDMTQKDNEEAEGAREAEFLLRTLQQSAKLVVTANKIDAQKDLAPNTPDGGAP